MPTINLPVQATGSLQGWSSIVGASTAHEAIDDSDTTTHDSDTTYIVIPKRFIGLGRVSFRFFDMAEHLIPTSIVVRAAMKKATGAVPEIEIGFYRGGVTAFSVTTVLPGAGYGVSTTTFNSNPFNASPWAEDDTDGLEICIGMKDQVLGSVWLSLVSVGLTYQAATYHRAATVPDDQGVQVA